MNEYNKLPEELSVLESNLDKWLLGSQNLYEYAIREYIKAREEYINMQIAYNKQFASTIEQLKESKYKMTIIKEIAHDKSHVEYKNMLEAETKKKKFQYMIQAIQERINMIKYLMKRNMKDYS